MRTIKLKVVENQVSLPTVIEGISPVLEFEEVEAGINMTATDHHGSQTVLIPKGEKGDKGDPGDFSQLTEEQLSQIGEIATENLHEEIVTTYATKEESDNKYALKNNAVILNSISMGRSVESMTGQNSFAMGNSVTASSLGSHAEGSYTQSTGSNSHAEGTWSASSGSNSHAEGVHTESIGENSHAEGSYTRSVGINSHAEGSTTQATGPHSHAEGAGSAALGLGSHAEGASSVASGSYSHAEAIGTSSATYSHAEGSAISSTIYSHAEGMLSESSGTASHAEGTITQATGTYSHAEGQGTIASGLATHAEGTYNYDRTIGDYSSVPEWVANMHHYIGDLVARNNLIYSCIQENDDATFSAWKWKIVKTSFAHVVGNAKNENSRSNAYALDWEGNGMFAGDAYVHADEHSENGKKLATEEYVQARIAEAIAQLMQDLAVTITDTQDAHGGTIRTIIAPVVNNTESSEVSG